MADAVILLLCWAGLYALARRFPNPLPNPHDRVRP